MNKKILIFVALVVVGLGIGTFIGLKQIKQTKMASADGVTNQQQQVLTRTEADRRVAIDKIKSFFGKDLTITYIGSETKNYSYGIPDPATITDFTQLKTIETYTDNQGFTIKVDAADNEILSKTKDCTQNGHTATNDQAKMIAEGLLAKITGNPDSYKLFAEDKNQNVYNIIWEKTHEGQFYNIIPSQKEQTLAKREERTIAICLKTGELMSYEYKPALTETELAEMGEKWQQTQNKDIGKLKEFLGDSSKQFTFVNYINENENLFRVYMDESGYCYDIEKSGYIRPNTDLVRCKTPKL